MELRGCDLRRFAMICAGLRNVWKCKSLGKTYYFRTWSRPKSDPTPQMQISMQTQVQNSNANATWSDFCLRFTKICSPLQREAHFWKPTLSNRPSKIHFLEHWRLQMRTHWAIFSVLMALKLFFSRLFRFSRPSKFWKFPCKTRSFCTGSLPKSDPTLQMQISMQTQVQIRMQMQFKVIFDSVWVRLKRFLHLFGFVFASFFDGLGSASAHASAHAIANESATVIWLGRPVDCQYIDK